MVVGSTSLGTSYYNPSGNWNAAWQAQYSGETGDLGSDVPGQSGAHVRFNSLAQYDSGGNTHLVGSVSNTSDLYTPYYQQITPYVQGSGMALGIWSYRG